MRESIDILGVFHDGSIVEIIGDLPNITFRIEIEYLRNMFSSNGNSFLAHITGCEYIEFYGWENEAKTTNLKEIQALELEILSVEEKGNLAHVICTTGELDILYKTLIFELDSGESVTYTELTSACSKYWEHWANRGGS